MPCLQDRARPALSLVALDPIADTLAEPHSYGFRLARATADAIDQGQRGLSQSASAQWSFEGDLRACFDSWSHDWVVAHRPRDQAILRPWLQAGFMAKHLLAPTETGVPPGGVLSPVLMHLALTGLESHITRALPTLPGTHRTPVHGIRCADDGIITGSSKGVLEQAVQPLVKQLLAERGLTLSREKTRVTHLAAGWDLLGTRGRKERGKLLGTPAKKHVRSFLDTSRGIVKRHQQALTGNWIRPLHSVLRGWAPSHQHGASQRPCATVDQQSFPRRWQGARRRHPRHARPWIRDNSFRAEDGNHWVCFGHGTPPQGTPKDVRLCRAASVPIRRHTKIKGAAHPYDPQWEPSFEARLGVRLAHNRHGRRYLLRLWKEQDGRCAVGHQRLTQLTGWHSHHVVWRTPGGSAHAANRVLLHPNCHAQVHSQGVTGVKPRPSQGVGKA
jgi:RNA-directed DNA polymerase